jgi:hypothetical protein
MWESMRSGDWLDEARLRVYPAIFLALSIVAVAATVVTAQGRFDAGGHPLGTDFSQVWVAGLEAAAGHPEQPFDIERHIAAQRAEFGQQTDVFGWHYPPLFLAPARLLAAMPYLEALVVWQIVTAALYLSALLAIMRPSAVAPWRVGLTALAFPAALVNLGHGQNGFLTAGLLGFGFLALPSRPIVAGLCFGLLAYKPQFAVALPIALVAGGHWRAIFAAVATVAATVLASALAFGPESWIAFFESLDTTRRVAIEDGGAGFAKIQSAFAAVRLLGGDVATAYAAQTIVTAVTILALAALWRSCADAQMKAAAAIVAALIATPYSLDYDMTALAPAIAFVVAAGLERGFATYMKTALAAAFALPLAARPLAAFAGVPLGAAALVALLAAITIGALKLSKPSRIEVVATRHRIP